MIEKNKQRKKSSRQGQARFKPEGKTFFQVFHMGGRSHFQLLFPGHQQGLGQEVDKLGLWLLPRWEDSVIGTNFTFFATTLVPHPKTF